MLRLSTYSPLLLSPLVLVQGLSFIFCAGGLSMYSDSEEDEDDDGTDGDNHTADQDASDSDVELQAIIHRKKKKFESVERAIWERIQRKTMQEAPSNGGKGSSKHSEIGGEGEQNGDRKDESRPNDGKCWFDLHP